MARPAAVALAESSAYDDDLVLELDVVGIRPRLWRRIRVGADAPFGLLHEAIQESFGWQDCHLHQFTADDDVVIGQADDLEDEEVVDEDRLPIGEILNGVGSVCTYEYDFGDSWQVRVQVKDSVVKVEGNPYVSCLAGKRSGPPEDCGGIYGYAELVELLKDPRKKDPDGRREWADGFDPEAFDVEKLNRVLAGFRLVRRRPRRR